MKNKEDTNHMPFHLTIGPAVASAILCGRKSTSIILRYMQTEFFGPDPALLFQLVQMKMPFGKYKDVLLWICPLLILSGLTGRGFQRGNWECCYKRFTK